MAQPTSFKLQYLGAVSVEANTSYTASDLASLFTDSNILVMKTKSSSTKPITVSINKSPGFPIEYNELSVFDGTTALSYVFNQDCIIAVAKELATA